MAGAPEAAQARVYADFGGLAALKREAGEDPSEAVDAVARQFEALFLQQILKQARSTSLGEDLLGGDSVEQYTEMLHQQLGLELAQGDGLGLRDVLVRQLSRLPGVTPVEMEAAPGVNVATPDIDRTRFDARAQRLDSATDAVAVPESPAAVVR